MSVRATFAAVIGVGLLAACGEDDVILPGERFDIRAQTETVNQALPVSLPSQQANADWGHLNGTPSHSITHPALGSDLQPQFIVNIGEGDSREARITAAPVVAGGVIYTLDARALVTATTIDGAPLWSRDVTPTSADAGDASGGGLAVSGGQVFVTTGFGEVTALDAATGDLRWRQDLDAPAKAAPTVRGDLVYLVSRDSTAWALNANNGRISWQQRGTPSTANFGASASPAVAGDVVVFPFPSGEVLATYPLGGIPRWNTVVSGDRVGRVASVISDIAGDPVISGDRVYIGNFGGRTVSIDLETGERNWTALDGAVGPVWPVGNTVFLLNDVNDLVRLDAATGSPVWRVPLPTFEDEEETRRERRVFAHYGPVLAGERLIVTSSDGVIRQFDPTSGAELGQIALPGGAASGPVVAGQTLYVVSKTGQLHAFR
ncbi:MAG: PQQ-binding-like beta-propeller repeat protein [Pseudomonadota bacterium]